jgi:tRNA 2-selenouridine synthase
MDDLMHSISYWNKPLLISPSKGELNGIANQLPIIDVRTPDEFRKGHIPSAFNIPLFSNEERAIVGTKYKQESRDTALQEALDFVAVKTDFYLDELHKIVPNKQEILIYCWRGGLRSAGMAKLFQADGYKVHILNGGYKSYRNHIRQSFEKKADLIIIGGMTGSGKTEILMEIGKLGEQILDLEKIAHHKGSAFGALGQEEQPTTEQFENNLFEYWKKLDLSKRIWLEDESQLIGKVRIPDPLFKQMRTANVIKLELDKKKRVERLMKEYTGFDTKPLIDSIINISRRLGGLDTRKAIEAVEKGDFRTAIDIVLSYYDKTYTYGLGKRKDQTVISLELDEDNQKLNAEKVIGFVKEKFDK